VKPCTNRSFPAHDYAGRPAAVIACEHCGHTSLLHPGEANRSLTACLACELQLLLPPRQDPAPFTPAGQKPFLAHIAVDVAQQRMLTYVDDEPSAVGAAQRVSGVVVSLPVSTDCRDNGEG
jgi:hypothetical protein